jgi:type IV secretion system protein VirB8
MAGKVEAKDLQSYLREAQSWEAEHTVRSERSRKLAWIVSGIASLVAVGTSSAVALLATRAPDPPIVLRVSEATGAVDVIERLEGGDTTYEEVTNKYWTERYIVFREGYLRQMADEHYNAVGLMSAAAERKRYGDWFAPANPASPLNLYGDAARVKVNIKSTSLIKPDVALVRFSKEVERPGGKPEATHWAATVVFKYSGAPMKESDRRVNPLGYQAIEYRIDPDAASGETRPQPINAPPPAGPTAQGVVLFPGQGAQPATPAQEAPGTAP